MYSTQGQMRTAPAMRSWRASRSRSRSRSVTRDWRSSSCSRAVSSSDGPVPAGGWCWCCPEAAWVGGAACTTIGGGGGGAYEYIIDVDEAGVTRTLALFVV